MKKQNIISIILVLALLILGASCSANKDISDTIEESMAETASANYETKSMDTSYQAPKEEGPEVSDMPTGGGEGGYGETVEESPTQTEKIIVTTELNLETKDFDKSIDSIYALVKNHSGYIESSSISGQSLYQEDTLGTRYANFSLRIPTSARGTIIDELRAQFNVTNINEYTNNITSSYYDTKTWLETLEEQYSRLENLLDTPDADLEYLLQVETEMSRIRYEINQTYTRLKTMDNQVDYSTINLYISEVTDYDPMKPTPKTFGERMSQAFGNSWTNFVSFMQSIAVGIVYMLPIIILAVIILVVVFTVRRKAKKSRPKKSKNNLIEDEIDKNNNSDNPTNDDK